MLPVLLISVIFIFLFLLLHVREPIYAVFCFILVVCGLVSLLFLLNAEYLALMFLLIYIGAIVVLFLFVTMLLNLKSTKGSLQRGRSNPWVIGGLLVFLIGVARLIIFSGGDFGLEYDFLTAGSNVVDPLFALQKINLLDVFAARLYNFYAPAVVVVAVMLLVALIGSILLTIV